MYLSLFLLQLFADFLQLMDALSSLTKLLSQVRNFLCFQAYTCMLAFTYLPAVLRDIFKCYALTLEILVFSFHGLQMIQRFLVGVLQFEKLSAERTSLLLGTFQLSLGLFILLLPLSQDLVKYQIVTTRVPSGSF